MKKIFCIILILLFTTIAVYAQSFPCEIDGLQKRRTGNSDVRGNFRYYEYSCPRGHISWVRTTKSEEQRRIYGPSPEDKMVEMLQFLYLISPKCDKDGLILTAREKTRTKFGGKRERLYTCSSGHEYWYEDSEQR